MVFANLTAGLAQMWANKRIVLIFYFTNLLSGLMIMLPFGTTVHNFIGNSLKGEKLGGAFDIDFLMELFLKNPSLGGTVLFAAIFGLILYLLVNLFLSGGAFATFAGSGNYQRPEFWGGAAGYFGRFFRLFLWTLPLVFAFFMLQFLLIGLQNLVFGSDPYEYITYWGNWIRLVLRGIFLMIFFLVFDYGRIYTVLTNETIMRNAVWQGVRFTFRNFRRTFTLGFAVFLMGVIAMVIYNPVANLFSAPSAMVIFLLFLWQQIFIMVRMMLRLSLYSGEVFLYKSLNREIPPALATSETKTDSIKEEAAPKPEETSENLAS